VVDEKLQARLEPVARDVVEMKRRQKTTERAAEEECRIAARGEIEHTAQRTAALGEWDVSRHREFGRSSILFGYSRFVQVAEFIRSVFIHKSPDVEALQALLGDVSS